MQIEDEVIVDSIDGGKLTLFGAAKDLGFFFWLFSAVVGAPSVLSLFKTVFVDLSFSRFLETLIAGYRELLDTIAGLLEPIATAVIHRFGTWLDFELELQPHWQPLFVLISIFITANIRTLWNDGYAKTTILFGAVMVLFALIGSWIAGIIAPQAPWWAQGVAASAPIFALFFGLFFSYAMATVLFGFHQPYRKPLASYLARGVFLASLGFVLAATISLTRLIDAHAGLLVLFSGMFLYGLYWMIYGFRKNEVSEIRFGLRMIGGFIFAICVITVETVLAFI